MCGSEAASIVPACGGCCRCVVVRLHQQSLLVEGAAGTSPSCQVARCIALEEKVAELDREIACDQRYIERVSS